MRQLFQYNNVERAKILFELFPSEMPAYLEFMKAVTDNLMRDPDQLKEHWDNGMITLEFWHGLAAEVQNVLTKYSFQLSKRSRLFSDQLFDGYRALYSGHWLQQYVKHQKPQDNRFISAVEMFF